ncbi:EI24 domain-containing protein [Plantactinospora sp. S1510]|uniref:EI24 domain-containing protein n=1 Tax=Plantactinospora alkalitolerans TaxID=2789879 RepID=A0ABS0HA53_9ACTN|nr:EI24 domain-containing protein [Plantactinospora alkalitolerans]MBF9135039.1 EI24 domain-containing protein [Plantactinospora alkalitolerans]
MLVPVEPTPAGPQRQWIPRQVPPPNAEAVRQASRAIVTGAAQTARTAAYRGTRPIVNFFAGIGCFWRGLARFLTSPVLWLYALAPLVLLALAMFGIMHAMEATAEVVVHSVTSFAGGWPQWIHGILNSFLMWGARLVVHAALGYLVLPLSIVLGAPCYVLLARRLERKLDGTATGASATGASERKAPPLWRACLVAVRQAVLVTLVLQLGWLLLAPLLLIPGVNLLAAFSAVVVFNGFLVGLLLLSIPLYHHGISTFRGQLRVVWRHRASVIGFGATSILALSLPFTPLRALVAPMVFTGAVLLHHRMRGADEMRQRVAAGPTPPALPPAGTGVPGAWGPWSQP